MNFNLEQPSYVAFRNILTERTNPILAWVGAGLSVPAGLPTWLQLRSYLCDILYAKAGSLPDGTERRRLTGLHQTAEAETELWDAFTLLQQGLGRETYRRSVRAAFSEAASVKVPSGYKKLWSLGLAGILNLNIDRLASRAFASLHHGAAMVEFNGKRAGQHIHVLKEKTPFVANLHGVIDDDESWILTKSELSALRSSQPYKQFISSCLTSKTLLFVGISADDVAAGGYLRALTKMGMDVGTHFWLTDRNDETMTSWAEESGIQVIRYQNESGDHSELDEFFADLDCYLPTDPITTPVVPPMRANGHDVANIQSLPSNEIRTILNAQASEILATTSSKSLSEYAEFCTENRGAIHRAWFVDVHPPENVFMDYTVSDVVAEGSFGKVYRGASSCGGQRAIKLLHQRVHDCEDRLQAFRRGVASMGILSSRGVKGIVGYLEAFELPASVVMEFVEGVNLDAAVREGVVNEWHEILHVATRLTSIIRSAHQLPERVLHRDLRPSNIMIRNCWSAPFEPSDHEIVVLDFDLSWHVDAFDMSITDASASHGYLAPELINRRPDVSTRHSAVDSFGVGMTLFFLRTGDEPEMSQHKQRDWQHVLREHGRSFACEEWHSAPARYFRLVDGCTQDAQCDRWDLAGILGELEQLSTAVQHPSKVRSTELLAEELCCRAFGFRYEWDAGNLLARVKEPGTTIDVVAHESDRCIEVRLKFDRHGLARYKRRVTDQFRSRMERLGFRVNSPSVSGSQFVGKARCKTDTVCGRLATLSAGLQEVKALADFG